MYVPRAGANDRLPLFSATHATETFKSFWRQKERCRPLREPKLDSRRGRQPHTRHLFKKNPPPSPLRLSLSLSPPPSPMFVLQSLNHLTTSAAAGRVRECVSGSGRGREGGGSPATDRATDRVQRRPVESNAAFDRHAPRRASLRPTPAWRLAARRGQTPSLPSLPRRLWCSMITCLIAALTLRRAAVPSWPLIAQIKKQPLPGPPRWRVFPGQVSLFVHENDQATEGLDAPLFTRKLIRARWTGRQKSRWRWRRSLTL